MHISLIVCLEKARFFSSSKKALHSITNNNNNRSIDRSMAGSPSDLNMLFLFFTNSLIHSLFWGTPNQLCQKMPTFAKFRAIIDRIGAQYKHRKFAIELLLHNRRSFNFAEQRSARAIMWMRGKFKRCYRAPLKSSRYDYIPQMILEDRPINRPTDRPPMTSMRRDQILLLTQQQNIGMGAKSK